MKVIIAGSRPHDFVRKSMEKTIRWHIVHFPLVELAVTEAREAKGIEIDEGVCGLADGVDRMGKRWAKQHGIPVKDFPANWRPNGTYDHLAGIKRNAEMADYADALIAIWDGVSSGTSNMIQEMEKRKKPVYVHLFAHRTV